mmetsp:Transcript_30986/g.68696  ORF Transcript_30986/g.68696 Transcript_30986/m.68696 type:complete len:297 (+) Transcript_30986:585-1475(+)
MTSSIFRIILHTWVARNSCCFLPMTVSNTFCSRMSLVPTSLQSMPRYGFFSSIWRLRTDVKLSMGGRPLFSARDRGTACSASANARIAYCSTPTTLLAASSTAKLQLISAAPPPYTMALSRTRLRATQIASCRERLISSSTILLPPRTKMVTALRLGQPSMTSILSLVVPNPTSLTEPAWPSFSGDSSEKRGTMRAPVAMASSSISTPPTHRTAGRLWCMSRWFASSSKPHWQMTRPAPLSLHFCTMSTKYCCSCFLSSSNFSTVSISTLCLVLGLGGSNGHVRMAILTSLSCLGI